MSLSAILPRPSHHRGALWLEQSKVRSAARALLRLLAARFDPMPAAVERAVSAERLGGWIERAATVRTLAEERIEVNEPLP